MNIKRVIFGEPMPDKDDPKYKKRYERDFAAGEKFARKTGLSWLVMKTQLFANKHPVAFLIVTFSFGESQQNLLLIEYQRIKHNKECNC